MYPNYENQIYLPNLKDTRIFFFFVYTCFKCPHIIWMLSLRSAQSLGTYLIVLPRKNVFIYFFFFFAQHTTTGFSILQCRYLRANTLIPIACNRLSLNICGREKNINPTLWKIVSVCRLKEHKKNSKGLVKTPESTPTTMFTYTRNPILTSNLKTNGVEKMKR